MKELETVGGPAGHLGVMAGHVDVGDDDIDGPGGDSDGDVAEVQGGGRDGEVSRGRDRVIRRQSEHPRGDEERRNCGGKPSFCPHSPSGVRRRRFSARSPHLPFTPSIRHGSSANQPDPRPFSDWTTSPPPRHEYETPIRQRGGGPQRPRDGYSGRRSRLIGTVRPWRSALLRSGRMRELNRTRATSSDETTPSRR